MENDTESTQKPPAAQSWPNSPELAYVAPMALFLALIWIGSKGLQTPAGNSWYPWSYVARTLGAGALLLFFRRCYTHIAWNGWWLGLIVGAIGIVQWIAMQQWLERHFELFRPSAPWFDPEKYFYDPTTRWLFIAVRILGAVVVVPVMEELFWRDYLWRTVAAPNDFRLAQVGERDWKAFVIVALAFATVHGHCWLTAIVWGGMVGALLLYTKSLGACIIAHATTNLLLGAWVLYYRQWSFW